MGHRINEWVQRLMVPVCGIATITLYTWELAFDGPWQSC